MLIIIYRGRLLCSRCRNSRSIRSLKDKKNSIEEKMNGNYFMMWWFGTLRVSEIAMALHAIRILTITCIFGRLHHIPSIPINCHPAAGAVGLLDGVRLEKIWSATNGARLTHVFLVTEACGASLRNWYAPYALAGFFSTSSNCILW